MIGTKCEALLNIFLKYWPCLNLFIIYYYHYVQLLRLDAAVPMISQRLLYRTSETHRTASSLYVSFKVPNSMP